LEDTPCHAYYPSEHHTAEYREGPFIGYRYYETAEVPVRYSFGHGLSYTSFSYSDLQATEHEVAFTLTNTGSWDGAEIAQVYIGCMNGTLFRAKKELKGFTKVFLKAGESRRVTIPLDDKAFRYFNVATNRWEVEGGTYEICVTAGVQDVRLSQAICVAGAGATNPYGSLPCYETGHITNVSHEEFSSLLGRLLPSCDGDKGFGLNDALRRLNQVGTLPAKLLHRIVHSLAQRGAKKSPPDLNVLFIYNMPLRGIGKLTGGMFSAKMTQDLLEALTGHFFRGIGHLSVDFFRNKKAGNAFLRKLKESE